MDSVLGAAEWLFDRAIDLILFLFGLLFIALKWCFENWKFSLVVIAILAIIGAVLGKIQEKKREKRQEELDEWRWIQENTCGSCGETYTINKVGVEELDRYQTYKEIEERTAKGGYKTRQVRITKVKEKTNYKCSHCGNETFEIEERELS